MLEDGGFGNHIDIASNPNRCVGFNSILFHQKQQQLSGDMNA